MSTIAWTSESAAQALANTTTIVHFLTLTQASFLATEICFLVEFLETAQQHIESSQS